MKQTPNKILKEDEYVFKCIKCGYIFKELYTAAKSCPSCDYSGLKPQGKFILEK